MPLTCPHCSVAIEKAVPVEELVAERRKVADLTTKAALADRVGTELEAVKAQLAGRDGAHKREIGLLGSKFKDIDADDVRSAFLSAFDSQAAAEGGEQDVGKWTAAVRADPTKVSPLLRPFVTPDVAAAPVVQGAPPRVAPPANANLGARPAPTATSTYTSEGVRAMSTADVLAQLPAMAQAHPELRGAQGLASVLQQAHGVTKPAGT